MGSLSLPVAGCVSPYFTGRYTNLTLRKLMLVKCFIMGYSENQPGININLQSDDTSINSSYTVPYNYMNYSVTDAALKAVVESTITAFVPPNFGIQAPNSFVWDFVTPTDLLAAIPPAPSSYQTIVSQTGTAAPAVSGSFTPMNTYAGSPTFTWARTGAGVYTLTASSAIFNTSGKTGVFIAPLQNLNGSIRAVVTSTTVITVTTAVQSLAVLGLLGFTATNTDALLNQTMLYVQTYA